MAEVNFATKTISFNLVFFGPPQCGKKTWVSWMHRHISDASSMEEYETEIEKSISFSYKPWQKIKIEKFVHSVTVRTCSIDIQQNLQAESKILELADGIVFLADSNPKQAKQNVEYHKYLFGQISKSGRELTNNKLDAESIDAKWLSLGGKTLKVKKIPFMVSYNKRDLPNCMPEAQMDAALKRDEVQTCLASAIEGHGIFGVQKYMNSAMIDGVHKRKSFVESVLEE